MIIPIRIDPVDRDDRTAGCQQPGRPVGTLRREVLAASLGWCVVRPGRGTEDQFIDCWRKLLARYRRQ